MQTQPKDFAHRGKLALSLLLMITLLGTTSGLALAQASPTNQPNTPAINWQVVHNVPGVYWYTMAFPTASVGYAIGGPDWESTVASALPRWQRPPTAASRGPT